VKDLFLCHTGADKDWVRTLAEQLERETIDNRALSVWFDEWDIDDGQSIISAIGAGLKESRFVAVILSPAMVNAPWPTAEWQSLVTDDPLNRHGRILPVLRHKYAPFTGTPIEIPWILKPLKRFDFSEAKRHDAEYVRLLRHLRGLKPERGHHHQPRAGAALSALSLGHHTPDELQEVLVGNMLPVVSMPAVIHSDYTTAKDYPTVWKAFDDGNAPPFALHKERLFSFFGFARSPSPFKSLLAGTDSREQPVAELLGDFEATKMLIGLFNSALRQHCWKLHIRTSKKDRTQFYCPAFDGKSRLFSWGPSSRRRTLAKMVPGPKGAAFGVHHAVRMRFTMIGTRMHLVLEPSWMFTTDGLHPIEGLEAGVLSTKWGGRERNAGVFRNVLMWALLLSQGQRRIQLHLGASIAELEVLPALAGVNVGIEGDQVRIDRMLGGDGTGEVGGADPSTEDDLDVVAKSAMTGITDSEQPDPALERLIEEHVDDQPELPFG
jgi:hypothetical protein